MASRRAGPWISNIPLSSSKEHTTSIHFSPDTWREPIPTQTLCPFLLTLFFENFLGIQNVFWLKRSILKMLFQFPKSAPKRSNIWILYVYLHAILSLPQNRVRTWWSLKIHDLYISVFPYLISCTSPTRIMVSTNSISMLPDLTTRSCPCLGGAGKHISWRTTNKAPEDIPELDVLRNWASSCLWSFSPVQGRKPFLLQAT